MILMEVYDLLETNIKRHKGSPEEIEKKLKEHLDQLPGTRSRLYDQKEWSRIIRSRLFIPFTWRNLLDHKMKDGCFNYSAGFLEAIETIFSITQGNICISWIKWGDAGEPTTGTDLSQMIISV